ncbi:MAG TPA: hypothetical protein VE690_13700 [Rhodopila sp.]|nr:hypothetical protein [Rhodopila sp.]
MNTFSAIILGSTLVAAAFMLPAAATMAQPTAVPSTPRDTAYTDTTPGWTGRTLVPGSHSSIAGDADATRRFQTGQY